MPDFTIPMSNASNPAHIDPSIPMKADTRLPLGVTPVDFSKQFRMDEEDASAFKEVQAERLEKQRIREEKDRDRTLMEQYIKSGGDVNTPEGLDAATKELKGKLSTDAYANLGGIADTKRKAELAHRELINKSKLEDLKVADAETEETLKTMSAPLYAYEDARAKGGEAAGAQAFEASKQANLQMLRQQVNPVTGQPRFTPQVLDQFEKMDQNALKHKVEDATWKRKLLTEGIDNKLREAQTRAADSLADKRDADVEQGEKKLAILADKVKKAGVSNLSEEDKKTMAEFVRTNGPGVLGRFGLNPEERKAIIGEVTTLNKGEGVSAREGAAEVLNIGSTKKSLDKMVPQLDAITAYEKSVGSIGDKLVKIAKKVDTAGVPALERWIRAGKRSVEGDPDVSELDFQLNAYRTDIARIVNNPNLTGVLSDSARHEIESSLPNIANAEQIERLVGISKADAAARRGYLSDQIAGAKGRVLKGAAKEPKGGEGFPTVSKEEQAGRDSGRKDILRDELASEKAKLTALPAGATPEDRNRVEQNIRALEREIGGVPKPSESAPKGVMTLDDYLKSKGH